MSLEGRVALITGGNRGIGQAFSLGLAEDGADIAFIYRRNEEEAAKTIQGVEALGRKVKGYKVSLDDFDAVAGTVDEILKDFGKVDILVNNAGIASRGNTIVDTPMEEFQRLMNVHTWGALNLTKLVLPQMRELERGDVIMISSSGARDLNANGAPYGIAKNALEAMANTLYKEERPYGIRVNVVSPGVTDTIMGLKLMQATRGVGDDIHELDEVSPFGHVGSPEEVAAVVRFLVSPSNTFVTGETITVNGGNRNPA